MARLLLPSDFGLVAMVAVFVAISSAIVDCGFSRAIIQKQELSEGDLCTAFYFNLCLGAAAAAVLWVLAPLISRFYAQAELRSIIRWLSLSQLLGALGAVHNALLTRRLAFREIAKASIPAIIISGTIGVVMAYEGYGVWALVGQNMSQQGLRSLLLWKQSEWRPRVRPDVQSFRTMFPYGSRLALSGVLDQGFQNIYVLVIGKVFSPLEVGFYQRANAFQQLPSVNVQAVIGEVAFPLMSTIQKDRFQLKYALQRALQLSALFIFPLMALMAGLAAPMTIVLIGRKWLPAAAMLQPLCLLGLLYPLHSINLSLLMALGRSDCFLRLEIIKKGLAVANIVLTFHYGVKAMIWGMIVVSLLCLAVNSYYSKKFISYGIAAQFRDIAAVAIIAGVIFGVTWLVANYPHLSPLLQLLFGGLWSAVVFLGGIRLTKQKFREEWRDTLQRILPLRLRWLGSLV